jgi:hypothetical protein
MKLDTYTDTELERFALLQKLRESALTRLVFEKTDGTLRQMNCTLKDGAYPALKQRDLMEQIQPRNPNVLCVYDLDKNAWRSFRLNSIKSVAW